MSDFLIYAARLQDAGITTLDVTLGDDGNGMRTMRVKVDRLTPEHLKARYPERVFELCGTDRVLEKLKDDMAYSHDGPTPGALKAAIDAHPHLQDDLVSWFADYLACRPALDEPPEEGAEPELSPEDAAAAERMGERIKGMLHGLDIARQRGAMKT